MVVFSSLGDSLFRDMLLGAAWCYTFLFSAYVTFCYSRRRYRYAVCAYRLRYLAKRAPRNEVSAKRNKYRNVRASGNQEIVSSGICCSGYVFRIRSSLVQPRLRSPRDADTATRYANPGPTAYRHRRYIASFVVSDRRIAN